MIEKGSGSSVQLGSSVKIRKETDGKICEYILVGQEEADMCPLENFQPKARSEAPLWRRKKGDTVKVTTPGEGN